MKVAAIQLQLAFEDQESNYSHLEQLVAECVENQADLICCPELFSTGVTNTPERFAESIDGKTVSFLKDLSMAHETTIIGSYIHKSVDVYLNRSITIRKGEIINAYDKMQLFTYTNEHLVYGAGKENSPYKIGNCSCAALICYDIRFPELFGSIGFPHLITIQANWPSQRIKHFEALIKARALDNQAYVVGCNIVGSYYDTIFPGKSLIVDPWGNVLAEGEQGTETIIYADISSQKVEEIRASFPVLRDKEPLLKK